MSDSKGQEGRAWGAHASAQAPRPWPHAPPPRNPLAPLEVTPAPPPPLRGFGKSLFPVETPTYLENGAENNVFFSFSF